MSCSALMIPDGHGSDRQIRSGGRVYTRRGFHRCRFALECKLLAFDPDLPITDARRRSLLRLGATDGFVQSPITLPGRYARTSTPALPIRPPARGASPPGPHPPTQKGCQEQHVCQSMVHDTLFVSVRRPSASQRSSRWCANMSGSHSRWYIASWI